jgi:tetratricopeptide (TPR) repeat protein
MRSKRARRILTVPLLACAAAVSVFGQAGPSSQTPKPRSLTIITQPNSTVWVNDVRFGTAGTDGRLPIITAATGRAVIKVRADGFQEATKALLPTDSGDVHIGLKPTADPAELAFQEAERMNVLDRDKAAAAYQKAIKLRPGYVQAYVGLARVHAEGRKPDAAIKAIRDLRRIRPGAAEASAIEGRVEKESGDEKKALAAFKRAINEGKGFQPEAYTGLGLLYSEKAEAAAAEGDFELESAHYTESARNLKVAARQLIGSPDAVVVYQLLGLVYEKQKKYDEAIAIYEEFLRLFPDSNEAPAIRSFITQLKKQSEP